MAYLLVIVFITSSGSRIAMPAGWETELFGSRFSGSSSALTLPYPPWLLRPYQTPVIRPKYQRKGAHSDEARLFFQKSFDKALHGLLIMLCACGEKFVNLVNQTVDLYGLTVAHYISALAIGLIPDFGSHSFRISVRN
jgi:hypothetical protein